jgi:hypothetical protein
MLVIVVYVKFDLAIIIQLLTSSEYVSSTHSALDTYKAYPEEHFLHFLSESKEHLGKFGTRLALTFIMTSVSKL